MLPVFRANPPQSRYIRSMQPGGMGLFLAGVGIGKSMLMQEVACRLALLNPGQRGLIASHVLSHARVEHVPNIIARLKQYKLYDRHVKLDRLIYCRNGAVIQYGSADRPDTLDGWNVAWCLGDEIRYWRKDAHDKFMARFRVKRAPYPFVGFFTTPEMNWMFDVYGNYDANNFFLVRGSTYENRHNLRPGYFDDLKRRLSPAVFKQYVEGHWAVFEGAVFEEFDVDTHVCSLSIIDGEPVHVGVDFGVACPASVFFQHLRHCPIHGVDNCIHVIDECHPNNTPTRQLAPMLRGRYRLNHYTMGKAYIDPAGTNRSQETGYPSLDYLEAEGFDCYWTYDIASRHIPNGIDVIRSKLRNASGQVGLYISDRLVGEGHERGIVKALQRTQYPKKTKDGYSKNEPRKDEYTHALDAFRYAMVNLFPPSGGYVRAE
jgi:hypothetical protein